MIFYESKYCRKIHDNLYCLKEVVFIVSGEEKAGILAKVLKGKVDVKVPSSIFQLHPNVTFIVDKDVAMFL